MGWVWLALRETEGERESTGDWGLGNYQLCLESFTYSCRCVLVFDYYGKDMSVPKDALQS